MIFGVTLFLRLLQALLRPHKVRFRCPACALERHDGDKPKVAEELGISLKTLYNKLNQTAALKKSA